MPPESERPFSIGDVLAGKYRIERVLGEGGMGVVVAATHLQLEQLVAVKFVLPSMLESKTVVERFLREARAAVRLRSEHVAKVLDVGTLESGAPFMVMEYLEGSDLGQVQSQRGPLPFDVAADYIVQACEAVAEAHSLGIVHRDLKPQNLFLTTRVGGAPLVKVLDFGISKMSSDLASGLTQTQTTIGSPLYMAPEQMRSARNVDGRADIWALGVCLYKLISGEVPFEADTMPALCYKVVHDPPRPLSEVRPDVPAGLAAIVARCLAKDPEQRFANVGELASSLEPFAPLSAYAVAERARSVSGGTRGSFAHLVAPSTGGSSPGLATAGTSLSPVAPVMPPGTQPMPTLSSWGDTKGGPRKGRRSGMLVAAAIAIVGVLAFVGSRVTRSSPAAPRDSAAASPAADPPPPIMTTTKLAISATAAPPSAPPPSPPQATPLPEAAASALPPRVDPFATGPVAPAKPAKPATAPLAAPLPQAPPAPSAKPAKPPGSGSPDDEIPSLR